jgi:PTS system mannose-specific IIB component/fructoselysine and glucoselysine-specific PTS system IIB component
MAIVLYRVDERLIHGQVVVGWGNQLHPERIVVVDDDLARSDWEQELYVLGLPADVDSLFVAVDAARAQLPAWRASRARILVLTKDLTTMRRLAEGGLLRGEEVNIGGIHYAPGRRAVLPYVFLSDDERSEMTRLADEGAVVSARDLPGARRVDLPHLLDDSRA